MGLVIYIRKDGSVYWKGKGRGIATTPNSTQSGSGLPKVDEQLKQIEWIILIPGKGRWSEVIFITPNQLLDGVRQCRKSKIIYRYRIHGIVFTNGGCDNAFIKSCYLASGRRGRQLAEEQGVFDWDGPTGAEATVEYIAAIFES
jgi:hypothetical protein